MKKSTLLAFAALLGGTAMGFAQDVIDLPGGLKASTKENPIYYRISNMRAQRLSYITGEVIDKEGLPTEYTDTWAANNLPAYLVDGESETPEVWDRPYMGLALVDDTFWCGFSAQNEVIDEATTYWWFEIASATRKSVYIHNAVITGALKNRSENITMKIDGIDTNLTPGPQQGGTSFSENAKQAWYVLPITEELQEEYLDGIDEYFDMENAFGLSKEATLVNSKGEVTDGCPDVSNYIVHSWQKNADGSWLGPWYDEDAQMVEVDLTEEQMEDPAVTSKYWYDETAEVYCEPAKFGFATLRICWNPLMHNGSNDNHLYNNGSLFTVEEVTDLDKVQAAIEAYKQIEIQANQSKAQKILDNAKIAGLEEVRGLKNLPALYNDTEKLDEIIAAIEGLTINKDWVQTATDVDIYEDAAPKMVAEQVSRARILAGDGTVITLQQMLAINDWEDFDDSEGADPAICNAYLSADGLGYIWAKQGGRDDIDYPAVTVVPTVDESCYWTLEYVANQGFRLKNGDNYIRKYGDWDSLLDWSEYGYEPEEDEDGNVPSVDTLIEIYTWALTDKPEEAAVFSFSGFPAAFQEWSFNENTQTIIDDNYETLGYSSVEAVQATTNIAHLTAPAPQNTGATPDGVSYLRRDGEGKDYMINSWPDATNQYFAAGSCWKIERITKGTEIEDGISEISAAPAQTGIYDMQGRKVAKAAKGLYIINGVKTLVK